MLLSSGSTESDPEEQVGDDDDSDVISMGDDSFLNPESASIEMDIRRILQANVSCNSSARDLVIAMMGLNRTLGTMAAIAINQSDNKKICVEASSTATVTASCERMLRAISSYSFIEKYAFQAQEDSADED